MNLLAKVSEVRQGGCQKQVTEPTQREIIKESRSSALLLLLLLLLGLSLGLFGLPGSGLSSNTLLFGLLDSGLSSSLLLGGLLLGNPLGFGLSFSPLLGSLV